MYTDPIADFLNRLSTASAAGKEDVSIASSAMIFNIAKLLEKEGFVGEVARKGKKVPKHISVTLAYETAGKPRIHKVKRISKPSRRIYRGTEKITSVKNGLGRVILSTPQGVMTGREAQEARVGGEVLFEIW